jgi:Flp pilus assembly protein TadG
MRRLSLRVPGASLRRRLRDERGAAAVMVALFLVPLLGCGAIAVDVSAHHADQVRLRTAADAAALAVAADCGRSACGNTTQTAAGLAALNAGGVASLGTAVSVTGNRVSVTVTGTHRYAFAPVLGIDSGRLRVTSVATWTPGATSGSASRVLKAPVGLSWCEYQAQMTQERPILRGIPHGLNWFTTSSTTCTGPDGTQVKGGRAVLTTDTTSTCTTTVRTGSVTRASSAVARHVSDDCFSGMYKVDLIQSNVPIPVWDQATTAGTTTTYRVVGYVDFEIDNISANGSDPDLTGMFTSEIRRVAVGGAPTVSLVREQ